MKKGDVANATSPFSFPCFPIFTRRHADKAVESDLEIIRVVVAAPDRDLGDRRVGREQEVLRFRHAAVDHVLDRRVADKGLEGVREIVDIDVQSLRDGFEADVLAEVCVDVFFRAHAEVVVLHFGGMARALFELVPQERDERGDEVADGFAHVRAIRTLLKFIEDADVAQKDAARLARREQRIFPGLLERAFRQPFDREIRDADLSEFERRSRVGREGFRRFRRDEQHLVFRECVGLFVHDGLAAAADDEDEERRTLPEVRAVAGAIASASDMADRGEAGTGVELEDALPCVWIGMRFHRGDLLNVFAAASLPQDIVSDFDGSIIVQSCKSKSKLARKMTKK